MDNLKEEIKHLINSREKLNKKSKIDRSKEDFGLQEYKKTIMEYKNTIEEFNDGDGNQKWTEEQLEKIGLTSEESDLINKILQTDSKGGLIIFDKEISEEIIFLNVSYKDLGDDKAEEIISKYETEHLQDEDHIINLFKNTTNEFEKRLSQNGDINYFDQIGIGFDPCFNHTSPEFDFLIPNFKDISLDKFQKVQNTDPIEGLKHICIHELCHNIDFMIGNIINPVKTHQGFLSEQETMSRIKQYVVFDHSASSNNYFSSSKKDSFCLFIQENNFNSAELHTGNILFENSSLTGHPRDSVREFFATYIHSLDTLNTCGLSLKERFDIFSKHNPEYGNDYEIIKNKYLETGVKIKNQFETLLIRDDLTIPQHQLLKSLIMMIDNACTKI